MMQCEELCGQTRKMFEQIGQKEKYVNSIEYNMSWEESESDMHFS